MAAPSAPRSAQSDKLGVLFSAEQHTLRDFVALLEREQALLQGRDVDSLLPLVEKKNHLSARLAEHAGQREAELNSLGIGGERAALDIWLALPTHAKERETWQSLIDLAARARELNRVNGELISLHLQHNQQAFAVLMSATNRAMTYGPDGHRQTGLGGRILGSA